MTLTASDHARFWTKVRKTRGCWYWVGARKPHGYGNFGLAGRTALPHRVSFVMHHGPIPVGAEVDHTCRKPACVNPAHLEAVTPRENKRRQAVARTHCLRGHRFDAKNTHVDKRGARRCRACDALAHREARHGS